MVFGPTFFSSSKAQYGPPLGVHQLAESARELSPFPLIALGGISIKNVNECLRAGASGVAGISLFGEPKTLAATVEVLNDLFDHGFRGGVAK